MTWVDRIAEPWGTRTPYGPGETWPTRVDSYLADGLTEDDVDRWVQSATILHSNGDGLDIAVKDDRIVGVRGRAVDRVNPGRLGPKDLFGWQANNSPDRLTKPLIRRRGKLVETDWDTAMDAVAGRCRELLEEQGPSAISFYTSGQLFLEEYYTLGLIAHGGIGTNHVDGNTRLCTATAAAAKSAAGWVGLALGGLALYAAVALELEGSERRTVLPLARHGAGRSAVRGERPLAPDDLAAEAGVRPQL